MICKQVKIKSILDVPKDAQGPWRDGKVLVFGEPYPPLFYRNSDFDLLKFKVGDVFIESDER